MTTGFHRNTKVREGRPVVLVTVMCHYTFRDRYYRATSILHGHLRYLYIDRILGQFLE